MGSWSGLAVDVFSTRHDEQVLCAGEGRSLYPRDAVVSIRAFPCGFVFFVLGMANRCRDVTRVVARHGLRRECRCCESSLVVLFLSTPGASSTLSIYLFSHFERTHMCIFLMQARVS